MRTPLIGPAFGSYAAGEVSWLLTDISDLDLEAATLDRERDIQTGRAHYAESLPVEYQPDDAYRALFAEVLAATAPRLAAAVGVVTETILADRGRDIVLASLARAGTPVGILIQRWAAFHHHLAMPHYAISIVRGRGIDTAALDYLSARYNPANVVFVDGWTGKGAITRELTAALASYEHTAGIAFDPDLAVLADPGHCVRTFGTRDDFLIASACLNSTVSGLISRTVLNPRLMAPGDFHGAKFYRHLAADDQSAVFLDAVAAHFDVVAEQVHQHITSTPTSSRTPTWAGMITVERIRQQYGINSPNFVKPGIGETTRVLLRRQPWRILLRNLDADEHRHIRMLAEARRVPIEHDPTLDFACVGLIKDLTQ